MNLRTTKLAALALAAITALAALAPAADAGSSRRWKDRDYQESRYSHSHGRSYFYHDPYCGITHAHVSAFKAHYDRCGHPPLIRKVDRYSGRIIKAYAWDGRRWRDASYARYDRGRYHDRYDDRYAYRH